MKRNFLVQPLTAQTATYCWTLRSSGGRREERVAGGGRTARLQYLSAPESGGCQPRTRHDANDPLLVAHQKERTSNPSLGACPFCCFRNSQHTGRRNVRRLDAAATADHRDAARPQTANRKMNPSERTGPACISYTVHTRRHHEVRN